MLISPRRTPETSVKSQAEASIQYCLAALRTRSLVSSLSRNLSISSSDRSTADTSFSATLSPAKCVGPMRWYLALPPGPYTSSSLSLMPASSFRSSSEARLLEDADELVVSVLLGCSSLSSKERTLATLRSDPSGLLPHLRKLLMLGHEN